MKKLIAILMVTFSLLILALTQARAESKNKDILTSPTSRTEAIERINRNETITQTRVNGIGKDHPKWKGFEMKGNINNVTATSFDLNDKSIKMDAAVTGKLQIKGILANNVFVKVEGKTIDGEYYAKEIKVKQDKAAEKDEDENDDDDTTLPIVSPTVSVSPTPSATPTAGSVEKTGDQYKISVTGSLEDIIKALEDLLNTLKSQVSPA